MALNQTRKIAKWPLVFAVLFLGGWLVSDLLYMDLLGIGRSKAKRQLPVIAQKMGLKETGAGPSKLFSKYSGKYSGYNVEVDPESSLITVHMDPIPSLSLSTYEKDVQFDTGNQLVDKYFKERKASDDISRQLVQSEAFLQRLQAFMENRRDICRFIVIQYDMIKCGMKFGNGHYIPASILEPVTSELVGLADALQRSVQLKKAKVGHTEE